MAAGRFVQRGRLVAFVAAGHPPAMLVSIGGLRRPNSQSDRLVLYTDGLIEVFNKGDEMLGVGGLEEFVRQSAKRALAEMKQAILDGVAAWRDGPLA